jgi:hypothetical protein
MQNMHRITRTYFLSGLLLCGQAVAEELLTYKLAIQNGRFSPETIEVPSGIRFKILVSNLGPGPEEFESFDLKKESVMGAGVTRPVVFAPLKPGNYKFFGEFHPETAKGQIVVK